MNKFQLKFYIEMGNLNFYIWKKLDLIFFAEKQTNLTPVRFIPSTSGSLDASDALSLVLQNW